MTRFLMLAVLLLSGCAGDRAGEKADLSGAVRVGPVPGPCEAGVPCSRPARGVELEFAREGRSAVRITSDERGHYKVRLEPGTYRVTVVDRPPPATLHPATITVEDDARLDFGIDSGVR